MAKKKPTGAPCPVHTHMEPLSKFGQGHGPTRCIHSVQPVIIGGKTVYAGGAMRMRTEDIARLHEIVAAAAATQAIGGMATAPTSLLVVPLTDVRMPLPFGGRFNVFAAPLPDFGGVPAEWAPLVAQIADEVRNGTCVLCYCEGGHGRTGTLLASLIAIMEPETVDPIAAVRERYCPRAIETTPQGEAIFALRQQPLPAMYHGTFFCDMIQRRQDAAKANAEPITVATTVGATSLQKK